MEAAAYVFVLFFVFRWGRKTLYCGNMVLLGAAGFLLSALLILLRSSNYTVSGFSFLQSSVSFVLFFRGSFLLQYEPGSAIFSHGIDRVSSTFYFTRLKLPIYSASHIGIPILASPALFILNIEIPIPMLPIYSAANVYILIPALMLPRVRHMYLFQDHQISIPPNFGRCFDFNSLFFKIYRCVITVYTIMGA